MDTLETVKVLVAEMVACIGTRSVLASDLCLQQQTLDHSEEVQLRLGSIIIFLIKSTNFIAQVIRIFFCLSAPKAISWKTSCI